MKKICMILCLIFILCGCRERDKSNVLPKNIDQVRYNFSEEKELKIGDKDLFSLTKPQLKGISEKSFEKEFETKLPLNERDAIDIATMALVENYKDCNKKETPFLIKYSEKSGCYIIYGTQPFFSEEGIGICAVEKNSGKVIMVIHT